MVPFGEQAAEETHEMISVGIGESGNDIRHADHRRRTF